MLMILYLNRKFGGRVGSGMFCLVYVLVVFWGRELWDILFICVFIVLDLLWLWKLVVYKKWCVLLKN